MSSESSNLLKATNIFAFILTVLVNSLAGSTTFIGGRTTADISDLYPTLVTPAGYVFAIWGIIYILLGAFVVYQALPSQKEEDYHKRISWLFIASSLLNITWLFLWQNEILSLSVLVMFLLLASLIAIYLRLNIGKTAVPLSEKLAVHLPFSIYLGWITIASIANVAAFLVSINWDGFGISQETWAILIIIIALLIGLVAIATRKDIAYTLVIIWALVGIAAKQSGEPNIVFMGEASAVILGVAAIVVIVLAILKRR